MTRPVDSPASHLRNAQQILVLLKTHVGNVEFMDVDAAHIEGLRKSLDAVNTRIQSALDLMAGKRP